MNLFKSDPMTDDARKIRLTDPVIKALPIPPKGTRVTYRDKGTPGLELRISGTPLYSWTYQYKPTGADKPTRETLGSWPSMSADAAREEASRLTRGRRENGLDPRLENLRPRQVATLAEVLDAYEQFLAKHRKPKTLLDFRQQMKAVRTDLGRMPVKIDKLEGFTGAYLTKWMYQHRTARGSARATVKMIRQAYNHAMKEAVGILPKGTYNPGSCLIRETDSLKGRSKPHARALEDVEMSALLAAFEEAKAISRKEAPRHPGVPPMQLSGILLIEFLMVCGARKSEGQLLEWKHIKGDLITLTVHKRSGEVDAQGNPVMVEEPRTIYLSDDALRVLEEAKTHSQRVGYTGSYVFPTCGHRAKKEYICRPDWNARWIGVMAGFEQKLKCHNLRSIYINYHRHNGVDLSVVSNNVGHASIKTTQEHYVANPKSIRRAGIRVGADYLARMRQKIGQPEAVEVA
jgi:integrase